MNEYKELKKAGLYGFAHAYLDRCYAKAKSDDKELRKAGLYEFAHAYLDRCFAKARPDDEIDVEVYAKLVQLDSKLGTTASKQLDRCIFYTTRSDIIQVFIFAQN